MKYFNPIKKEESSEVFDLNRFLEKGLTAEENGKMDEAKKWYSAGLLKAKNHENNEMIEIFNRFIFTLFL
ncbi:MAG: hypothetical protein HYR91_11695 [Flavobacteriia bacterium]|nr:hypothetical protein [Flavobacteriia bacterium]